MTQQSYYTGRASGLRHAIDLLDVLVDSNRGCRFGAKTLAGRVQKLLRAAIEEERHLTQEIPAAAKS